MSAPLLQVAHVSKSYDGVEALRDVSLDVARGECVALIGPNGAGKTTLFNVVNGQLAPDDGTVTLDGRRIDGHPPREIARLGVGRTFQVAATFASMTVRENVALALAARVRRTGSWLDYGVSPWFAESDRLLAKVGVDALADAHAATLAYGDVKRIELALALAAAPQLLLMDEPTAGMAVRDRGALMLLARGLAKDEQLAVLFTEHDMDIVFEHADRIVVLDRGRVIASGPPAEIRTNPEVQEAYLGTPAG